MEETTLGESQITMPVKGMSCAGCVSRVERALSAVDGVSNAEVNLATKRATVSYDPDATAPKALIEAVNSTGFEVPSKTLSSPTARRFQSVIKYLSPSSTMVIS